MSDYRLVLSRKALNDTRKALSWYDDISSRLKLQLIDELDIHLSKIQLNPNRYGFSPVLKSFHRVQLSQFPYYILYTIDETTILVAGVVHSARSPHFVRRRYQ